MEPDNRDFDQELKDEQKRYYKNMEELQASEAQIGAEREKTAEEYDKKMQQVQDQYDKELEELQSSHDTKVDAIDRTYGNKRGGYNRLGKNRFAKNNAEDTQVPNKRRHYLGNPFSRSNNNQDESTDGEPQDLSDDNQQSANPLKSKKSSKNKGDKNTAGTIVKKAITTKLKAIFLPFIIGLAVLAAAIFLIIIVFFFVFNNGGGGDVDTDTSSFNSSCMQTTITPMDVSKTSLTKQEFVDAVNNFSSSNSHYQVFKANASTIYDLGVSSGINPELLVIRAFIEGFAPGTNNNYWGIGCENGHPEKCKSYSSFEEGVKGFYKTVSNYNTEDIVEVMSNYVYIGEKWYSPGSSSLGGCYYYSYIKDFLSSERSAEVQASCANHTEINTTQEDQDAYVTYQVKTETIPRRQQIFGLSEDNTNVCRKKVLNLSNIIPTGAYVGIMTAKEVNAGAYLEKNGSSVKEFNDKLLKTVKSDGIGSRKAVVDAALQLVETFDKYNIKLPYSYQGGWGGPYTTATGENHNFYVNDYYGINPYFGEEIYSGGKFGYNPGKPNNTYYYLGLDCSGFVTWSLHNGGINHPLTRATDYKNTGNVKKYPVQNTSQYIGKPGDVLSSNSHVMLVISYDESKASYLVAEAGGKEKGILVQYRKIANMKDYYIVDMSDYYANHVNTNYEQEFNAKRKG